MVDSSETTFKSMMFPFSSLSERRARVTSISPQAGAGLSTDEAKPAGRETQPVTEALAQTFGEPVRRRGMHCTCAMTTSVDACLAGRTLGAALLSARSANGAGLGFGECNASGVDGFDESFEVGLRSFGVVDRELRDG